MSERRIHCFLHIPRTAGTTLNTILANNFSQDQVISLYTDVDFATYRTIDAEHLRQIRLIQGHLLLQRYDPPQMYSHDVVPFTFLRDPVERLVSEYVFLKTWKKSHMYKVINDNRLTFADYVTCDLKHVAMKGKNFMTRVIAGESVDGEELSRKALAKAKHNLEHVFGFFGIQELFDESLVLLAKHLGLRDCYYERRNVLNRGVLPDVDRADRELAARYNEADIELYAFAAGLFRERLERGGPGLQREIALFQKVNAKFQNVCRLLNERAGAQGSGPQGDPAILSPKG